VPPSASSWSGAEALELKPVCCLRRVKVAGIAKAKKRTVITIIFFQP
jgi:hypothetical protein